MKDFEEKRKEFFCRFVYTSLEEEFANRQSMGSNNSLRSFARDLEIDPTFLSRLLSQKMRLTFKTALRLAKKLDIPINEVLDTFSKKRQLPEEMFDPISKWYYFAIIELRHHRDFQFNAEWVSQMLPISFQEAEKAIFELKRHNHIVKENDEWVYNLDCARWDGIKRPNKKMTDYQKEISVLASEAIIKISPEDRDTFSLTVAADPKVLPVIRQKIRNLSEEIAEICSDYPSKNQVYQFQSNFFSLINDKRNLG